MKTGSLEKLGKGGAACPSLGLHAKHLNQILGKKIKSSVKRGTALAWNLLQ